MEFLGNKSGLLDIVTSEIIARSDGGAIADLFSGTAAVSSALADRGHTVHANDLLPLAVEWAHARVRVTELPTFSGLSGVVPRGDDPYGDVARYLQQLPPNPGWITRSFTPASRTVSEHERKYFTVDNGARIDAIRTQINDWKPLLSRSELALLRCSLVDAADRVGNTAGTYGSYMSTFKPKALHQLEFRPVSFGVRPAGNIVTSGNAQDVVESVDADVVYADPPYTKRQYAAYYHVLNAIVGDSEPEVGGKTGLANWRRWTSDWCHARKAPGALAALVEASRPRAFVLSYSSDGHIAHETILDVLASFGRVTYIETERRRYRSSALEHRATSVLERVYSVAR